MKQYSFLCESIGRNLIGASKFTSRKNVASQILNQYPHPDMLASKLQQMGEETFGNERQKLLDLSLKCRGCSGSDYIKFVNNLAGFSALWKYLGIGLGTIGTASAINYAINKYNENPAPTLKDAVKRVPGINSMYSRMNNWYMSKYK